MKKQTIRKEKIGYTLLYLYELLIPLGITTTYFGYSIQATGYIWLTTLNQSNTDYQLANNICNFGITGEAVGILMVVFGLIGIISYIIKKEK